MGIAPDGIGSTLLPSVSLGAQRNQLAWSFSPAEARREEVQSSGRAFVPKTTGVQADLLKSRFVLKGTSDSPR